jgi:hypothetical protein
LLAYQIDNQKNRSTTGYRQYDFDGIHKSGIAQNARIGVKCPKEKIKGYKSIIKENKEYIAKADFLSKSKRLQFKLFLFSTPIYGLVFKIYRLIKKV